jgi:VanZ family protein
MKPHFAFALAGVTGIIIYGSLYPFDFFRIELPGGPIRALLSTWPEHATLGDALANILLYIPFGFCAVQSFHASRWRRAAVSVTAGIALSVCMELLQLYDKGRWASMSDVRANAAGALLGTVTGLAFERAWKPRPGLRVHFEPFVLLLLACWAGYRLFPYAPVIDLHKYWHAVQPLLRPQLSALALCRHAAAWLALALVLEELVGAAHARLALPALLCAVLLARLLIDDAVLSASEVAGGTLAVMLWGLWLWRIEARAKWICGLFVSNLILQGLAPFHFAASGQRFVWIPFYGFLEGEPRTAVPSFFEKAFNYGALLWLLARSGLSYRKSAVAGSVAVAAISLMHIYIPGRTAEITDLVLFLSLAAVLPLTRSTLY